MKKNSKKSLAVLAIGTAAMLSASPASALDITPYGMIGVGTFWTESTYYNTTGPTGPSTASRSDSDFSLDLFGDSKVGVRVKEGDFFGIAEIGAYNPKAYSKGLQLRLLFGKWDFGKGNILVGYVGSPYVYRTQQVYDSDGGTNGYGSLYDGFVPQIKLTMNNGLYLTLMRPTVGNTGNNTSNVSPNSDVLAAYKETGNSYQATYANYNNYLPKIVTGYEGKYASWKYGGGVAYNMYNVKTVTAAGGTPVVPGAPNIKTDIHSYLVFFHGTHDLAPFEVGYNVFTGRNVGDLLATATGNGTSNTLANPGSANGAYFDVMHGVDSYTYGGLAQIGYALNAKTKFYAGVSYVVDDNRISHADERMSAFVQMQYKLSKNFRIIPEVGFMNDMYNTLGQKEPRILYTGAKWEMTF